MFSQDMRGNNHNFGELRKTEASSLAFNEDFKIIYHLFFFNGKDKSQPHFDIFDYHYADSHIFLYILFPPHLTLFPSHLATTMLRPFPKDRQIEIYFYFINET